MDLGQSLGAIIEGLISVGNGLVGVVNVILQIFGLTAPEPLIRFVMLLFFIWGAWWVSRRLPKVLLIVSLLLLVPLILGLFGGFFPPVEVPL